MKYKVIREKRYDFSGQKYGSDCYPNIHKYPASMIPQIGIEILNEFGIKKGKMMDPYCGSGSSFASGIEVGIKDFTGYDLNPLAVLICEARFTKLNIAKLEEAISSLREYLADLKKEPQALGRVEIEKFNNFDYWFDSQTAEVLQIIKNRILEFKDKDVLNFLFIALSSTMRECSYVKSNEFKLYRIKLDSLLFFSPNVVETFFKKLADIFFIYKQYYHEKLGSLKVRVKQQSFEVSDETYDIVLTSPPYGDSRTTVAYGQFSFFSNEWILGENLSRQVDNRLMGGGKIDKLTLEPSLINDYIYEVAKFDEKRASEVSAFYKDLRDSIVSVTKTVAKGGKAIYVVGNRLVKGVRLPTDQFVAEVFSENGFGHLISYERAISNKRMPSLNSPSNKVGEKSATMNSEFIVVCEKHK